MGTPVVLGTFRRLFFGHNLGSSCDRNDLGCSPLVFCRHTGHRVPIDIVPLFGTVPLAVVVRPEARLVPLVDLIDYTHTGP